MVILSAIVGTLLGFALSSYVWSKHYNAERYVALVNLQLKVKKFINAETPEEAGECLVVMIDACENANARSAAKRAAEEARIHGN